MAVSVREITSGDFADWDQYVRAHKEGSFCHLSGWKTVVELGARQACPYMVAETNGAIVGILPLTHRKSLLFGEALTSSMFAVYGGPLANSDEAYDALDEAAWKYAQERNLDIVSYKTVHARHKANEDWAVNEETAATFIKSLPSDPEEILLNIPRKQRAVVRKSLKKGLTCDWDKDLDTFYHLYAVSVRNLGTPVFPKAMFQAFCDVFGSDVDVQVIYTAEGEAVASLMSFYFKDVVLPYYAGGDISARKYGAHDFMYYQLMMRAAERGVHNFDFGRSKIDSGPYKFKKNWGFEPTPLEYETRLSAGASPSNLSPSNKKFALMIQAWKKLPLPIANLIGPCFARHLG